MVCNIVSGFSFYILLVYRLLSHSYSGTKGEVNHQMPQFMVHYYYWFMQAPLLSTSLFLPPCLSLFLPNLIFLPFPRAIFLNNIMYMFSLLFVQFCVCVQSALLNCNLLIIKLTHFKHTVR